MNETAMIVIKWIGKFEKWRIKEEKIENVKKKEDIFSAPGCGSILPKNRASACFLPHPGVRRK